MQNMLKKPIVQIFALLFIPVTILGGIFYLFDVLEPMLSNSENFLIMRIRREISFWGIPIAIASSGIWLMCKHTSKGKKGILQKSGIILLSWLAVIYGYDMIFIINVWWPFKDLVLDLFANRYDGWAVFLAVMLGIILAVSYVVLSVAIFIVTWVIKKRS